MNKYWNIPKFVVVLAMSCIFKYEEKKFKVNRGNNIDDKNIVPKINIQI